MIRLAILLASLSAVGLTSWTAPGTISPRLQVDTIPFRGVEADTLGRLASNVPGWGNVSWPCQDSVRAGSGTAYVWKVTTGAASGAGSLVAAVDSAEANDGIANCHDIILLEGGFYEPNFGSSPGNRYDDLYQVRISGQTAVGEGATFTNYSGAESRGGVGRIFEYFRIRDPGGDGGVEALWRCRACSLTIQQQLSVAWPSVDENLMILEGGTNVVTMSGDSATNHTIYANLMFEPDSAHATHITMASSPDTILRRPKRVSFIGNFMSGPGRRMPRLGSQIDSVSVIDNISYNWQNFSGSANANSDTGPTYRVDWFGYYAREGPRSSSIMPLRIGQNDSTVFRINVRDIQSDLNDFEVNADPDSLLRGSERVVGCENLTVTGPGANNGWCTSDDDEVPLHFFVSDTMPTGPSWAEYTIAPFDETARETLLERLGNSRSLQCSGEWTAWGAQRDSIDTRAVTELGANTGVNRLVNTSVERTVGEPADGTDCTDTDGDGLPNEYETSQCGTTTCIPGWSEWVNGRYAGDWYLQGCNLDGTLVGDRTTSCGGEALVNATFGAVERYVYIVPTTTVFGIQYIPDITPLSAYRFAAWNAAQDSAVVVTCDDLGTPADSATVDARLVAWNRPTLSSALAVRDFDPFTGMEC